MKEDFDPFEKNLIEQDFLTFERNFLTLFLDSFRFLQDSFDADFEGENTYARGSILNSILLIELVSNICIDTLELEKHIFNEIDRLSVIGKFDFYLRIRMNKKIELGTKYIQGIRELKGLRDSFVHPKKHELTWTPITDGSGGKYTGQSKTTKIFDISKNPSFWCSEDAIKTMRGVHDFFGYFFKTLCEFSEIDISALLFSEDKIPNIEGENAMIPCLDESLKYYLEDIGIDISYMGIQWHKFN